MPRFPGRKTFHREYLNRKAGEIRNMLHVLEMRDELDQPGCRPPVDIYETCGEIVVEFELPGFSPEEISLRLSGMTLILEACRPRELADGCFICVERNFGEFYHAIQLAGPIDADAITADYRLGVLRVTCPRAGDMQIPIKEIAI